MGTLKATRRRYEMNKTKNLTKAHQARAKEILTKLQKEFNWAADDQLPVILQTHQTDKGKTE